MDELKTGADGQTFALQWDTVYNIILYKKMFLAKQFKFLTEGIQGIRSDAKGMLIYDLVLPFNNALHSDEGCVPAEKLTVFYKEKESIKEIQAKL